MVPGSLEREAVESSDCAWPVYGCTVDHCLRHYDVMAGYFDVIDGKTLAEKYGKRCCEKDGMALHIESYVEDTEEVWRCPEETCGHQFHKCIKLPEFLLVS
jgi:hypothetical protein